MQIQKYTSVWLNVILKNKQKFLYKYIPTALMLMLSAYIYSLLRGVKDSILVPSLGAELISFIKFYAVFPATIIFFICFSKLTNILRRDKLYYTITIFFIVYFLIYAFLISPNSEFLRLNLAELTMKYPSFKYQIIMIENWTISLFYLMSELCGTVLLTLLFWQFANDLYSIKEAKNSYALFGILGQVGLIIAGFVQEYSSKNFINMQVNGLDDIQLWDISIKFMMLSIALAGCGLIILYRFMYKNVMPNPELCDRIHNSDREKVKLSVIDSFKYVFSSKYLWLIMMIVFCYGVGINLIESVWKDQLRLEYQTQSSYSAFMGSFNVYFGCITIFIMILGAYIIRKFKWIVPALCTPIGAGSAGILFFILIIFKESFQQFTSLFSSSLSMIIVIIGSMQVVIFKAFNYAFVDATKEMAFIPLDRELRTKGKAAVDVIGGRFGKSFGAILLQLMFQFISPNLADLTREICIIFILAISLWVVSVIMLNKEFARINH